MSTYGANTFADGGGGGGPFNVVTLIAVLCAELPAASLAATLKLYVVTGDKPVIDMLGLLVVPAATPFLNTV
jgi:hypothetical protein